MNHVSYLSDNLALEISEITQQILDFSEGKMVITDTDWRIIAFNHSFTSFAKNYTGLSPEPGMNLHELYSRDFKYLHPDLVNKSLESIYHTRKLRLEQGEEFEHINGFIFRGKQKPLRSRYRPLYDDLNQVIGFVETHHTIEKENNELTDLQQINEELKEGYWHQSRLLEKAETDRSFSDQMLWGIFQASPEGIGLLGLDGKLEKANPALLNILGLNPDEIQSLTFDSCIHKQDKKQFLKLFEELITGKRDTYQVEIRILKSAHETIFGLANVSILRDSAGKAQHVICMLSDITARKRLKENLRIKNKALEKANSYLDNFVHAIAHDLRAPIANLKQVAELLLMLNTDGDPIYSKLGISVERLDRTVSGLINIIDAQRVNDNSIEIISFEQNMERLSEDFSDLITRLNANIKTDFQVQEICYIAPYLESIMRNLFQNSLKYAHPARRPQISLSTKEIDGEVLFSIQDNGIGINLEEVGDRLFRPFKRFSQQAEGNGIGLHLVKSMVEKNDGRIEVQSRPGQGTRFNVYLNPYQKR